MRCSNLATGTLKLFLCNRLQLQLCISCTCNEIDY